MELSAKTRCRSRRVRAWRSRARGGRSVRAKPANGVVRDEVLAGRTAPPDTARSPRYARASSEHTPRTNYLSDSPLTASPPPRSARGEAQTPRRLGPAFPAVSGWPVAHELPTVANCCFVWKKRFRPCARFSPIWRSETPSKLSFIARPSQSSPGVSGAAAARSQAEFWYRIIAIIVGTAISAPEITAAASE
jgi:hypothetical protein